MKIKKDSKPYEILLDHDEDHPNLKSPGPTLGDNLNLYQD